MSYEQTCEGCSHCVREDYCTVHKEYNYAYHRFPEDLCEDWCPKDPVIRKQMDKKPKYRETDAKRLDDFEPSGQNGDVHVQTMKDEEVEE